MTTQSFAVRIVRNEDTYQNAGPFVVKAKSVTGAFRKVRNQFGNYFTNHISRECAALECNGVVSDRRGKVLAHYARYDDLRQPYAGRFA